MTTITLGGLTDDDRAYLDRAGREYREQMADADRPPYTVAARLPAICKCCGCVTRYCICRCCGCADRQAGGR